MLRGIRRVGSDANAQALRCGGGAMKSAFGSGCGVLLLSVLTLGCGAEAVSESSGDLQSAALQAGSDACMVGCAERGLDEAQCETLCNRQEDAVCYADCVEQGGDGASCRAECYAGADCHADCLADGGDDVSCREQCQGSAAPAGGADRCAEAAQTAYQACIDAGGDETTCREAAAEASDACDSEANACAEAGTAAYEACLAEGGDEESCREAAGAASAACTAAGELQ